MGIVVVERSVDCASDARALWCVITDTERLNRAIGLGPLTLERVDDDSAARYLVRTVSGGFPLEYEERPFEWVENRRFAVRRKVRRGAAHYIDNRFDLEPLESGGTRLAVRIEVAPKLGLLAPIVRLQTGRIADRIVAEWRRVDAELCAGGRGGFGADRSGARPEALSRARSELFERVEGAGREAAERLVAAVADEPEAALCRMRPYELAAHWGMQRRVVLATCLQAVVAGLLELSWDLVCPSCRTASDRVASLGDVGAEGHCQLCDIAFDVSLDEAVEATFRPAAAVREVDAGPYCIGGPARTPHVVTQAILPAGGAVTVAAPSAVGDYRLFVRGGSAVALRVTSDGEAGARLVAGESSGAELSLRPGAELTVEQPGGTERHVKIERVGWKSLAATAHEVSTLPELRRLFSAEVLRPGRSLRVGRVALLFTDLTQSTALYRTAGDAAAFRLVQDHFALIERVVSEHRGTLVKTMGDAVMAAFVEEEDALRAACAMHPAFAELRQGTEPLHDCYLKIGLYAGACYAVNANNLLDYFGQTVNVAARLQGVAGGGEVVIVEELADRAIERGWIDAREVSERCEVSLKGVGVLGVARLCPLTADC